MTKLHFKFTKCPYNLQNAPKTSKMAKKEKKNKTQNLKNN